MKKIIFLFAVNLMFMATAHADTKNPFLNYDPAYTKVITERSAKIVDELLLTDSLKYNRILAILVEQYRNLSAIYDFKDDQLNSAKNLDGAEKELKKQAIQDSANAALYKMHFQFLGALAAELGPEDIDRIKDGMTYGVFHNTYNGYLDMLPELTDEQKRFIYSALYEARELAMDQASSKAKHAMFGKYKGRINNYLSTEGYDLAKASKEWEERLKAKGVKL